MLFEVKPWVMKSVNLAVFWSREPNCSGMQNVILMNKVKSVCQDTF
jgi:hypothetical protein